MSVDLTKLVKPLVWHEGRFSGRDMFYADTPFGSMIVVAYRGRNLRWAFCDTCGDDSVEDWGTALEAQNAGVAHYVAQLLDAIDAEAAEALLARAYEAGRDDAAGICDSHGVLGGPAPNPYAEWKTHAENLSARIRALTPPADLAARLGGAE